MAMTKDDIFAVFDDAHILQVDEKRFTVRVDDLVITAAFKDIEVMGYDEYLEEMRDLMRQKVEALNRLAESLADIRQSIVTQLVIGRINGSVSGTVRRGTP